MPLSDLLQTRRREMNLTITEIADAVGVDKGTVSRWASGEIRNILTDKIVPLAGILRMEPMKVLEEIIK